MPGISMSGTALKWAGFLFVCLSSFSTAVIQRGIMGFGPDATAETMYQAMSPEGGMMGPGTAAVLCSLAAEIPYDFAMSGRLFDFSVQSCYVCAARCREAARISSPPPE